MHVYTQRSVQDYIILAPLKYNFNELDTYKATDPCPEMRTPPLIRTLQYIYGPSYLQRS